MTSLLTLQYQCFACANWSFCFLNLAEITKFKYERKNEIDPGGESTSSKMTPSCKYSIADRGQTDFQLFREIFLIFVICSRPYIRFCLSYFFFQVSA